MNTNIFLIIVIALFTSCDEKKLQITLLTNEIITKKISVESVKRIYSHGKFDSEYEKYQYTNVIKFKIVNPTDKKYLLFIKDIRLNDIYNIDVIIEDEHGNKINKYAPLKDPLYNDYLGSLLTHERYIHEEKELLLKKFGYNIRSAIIDFYWQELIIYPGTSATVYTSLSLPFVVEDNDDNRRRPVIYKFNPLLKYTFKIKYKLKDNIEEILPEELLDNYRANDIEIFKGEIETQKIPVIFK